MQIWRIGLDYGGGTNENNSDLQHSFRAGGAAFAHCFGASGGAGAGGAAHLPGMCAALFDLPVIGIPIHTKSLGGVDSLYSIVQMPSGIPVATVAIDGAANAAILAAKMLSISDKDLRAKLKDYKKEMKDGVMAKAEKLDKLGHDKYIEQM